ncbi:hypothetical protein Acr_13g0011460 [Actinidia rufa]|uniref:Uncharacterized protein n=1 Tax=Actinidia rufa TaxID=165716 RepID=A0A7J0FMZ3_9ERIC|nr:hypothetical protein Acr_13g0011460 [Actinidia rufa]
MLKGKIKIPEKARRVFPDRLGSLVAGFEEREEEIESLDRTFESGEELETFQPRVLGLSGSGREVDEYERGDGKCSDEELDIRKVRSKPDKNVRVLVSVKEIIAADEKRSDLEYEGKKILK